MKNKIAFLEKKLAEETEHNINLEQYTGRENLRFNNTEETPYEDCKAKVRGIIEEDLGVDISNMRFHAVHRVGKRYQDRCRPIIARFVCREDRDEVWSKKGKIKESSEHKDAYITEDFAKAIQEERKILIKVMKKAREEHGISEAKVKGRFIFIKRS